MEVDKEILTPKEQLVNIIYFVFRYILYGLGFSFLYIYIGKLYTIILICIFAFLAHSFYYNKKKVDENVIAKLFAKQNNEE